MTYGRCSARLIFIGTLAFGLAACSGHSAANDSSATAQAASPAAATDTPAAATAAGAPSAAVPATASATATASTSSAAAAATPPVAAAAGSAAAGNSVTAPLATSTAPVTGATSAASAVFGSPLANATASYDVHYKPQTKVIDDKTIAAAYRGVGKDGSLQFDAHAAPDVASLAPQTVVVFSGVALRKVLSVHSDGSTISVMTAPAALDDAIQDGHIQWQVPINFAHVAFEPPPGFHRVLVADDDTPERLFFEPALAGSGTPITFKMELKDWDIEVTMTPEGDDLHMDVDAKKTATGGGYIDLHATGELDGISNVGEVAIANGNTTYVKVDNDSVHGNIDLKWNVAFDSSHGGDDYKDLNEAEVEKLPLGVTIPFLVGPMPMAVHLRAGFAFSPFFSAKETIAQGEYSMSFGGSLPVEQTADGVTSGAQGDASSVSGTGEILSHGGTIALAGLGLSTTMMLPKVQVAVEAPEILEGILGESSAGPYVALLTQANYIATGTLSIVQCERRDLSITAIAGADASLFGHTITASLTPGKKPEIEIFKKEYSLVVPSNIKLCKPEGGSDSK